MKYLHAWNNSSYILLIFEYCCLNWFCKPCQSSFIGLKDTCHNLASTNNVKQNPWTLIPSWNWCVFIQSFILSRCASASSGFPENSGLKCENLNVIFVVLVVFVVVEPEGLDVLEHLVLAVLHLPYFTCSGYTMLHYVIFYSVILAHL